MSEINLGNLYEFNKSAYKKEKPYDAVELGAKLTEIEPVLIDSKYWMLLCHDRRDYTMFVNTTVKKGKFAQELKETLMNRGLILDIEQQKDGAFEIWIRDFDTNENFAYYLFEYGDGVVLVE